MVLNPGSFIKPRPGCSLQYSDVRCMTNLFKKKRLTFLQGLEGPELRKLKQIFTTIVPFALQLIHCLMTQPSLSIPKSTHRHLIKNFRDKYLKVVVFVKGISQNQWRNFIWYNSPGVYIRYEAIAEMPFRNGKYLIPFLYIAAVDEEARSDFLAAKVHQMEISRDSRHSQWFYGKLQGPQCTLEECLRTAQLQKQKNSYDMQAHVDREGMLLKCMRFIFSQAAREHYACKYVCGVHPSCERSFFLFSTCEFCAGF